MVGLLCFGLSTNMGSPVKGHRFKGFMMPLDHKGARGWQWMHSCSHMVFLLHCICCSLVFMVTMLEISDVDLSVSCRCRLLFRDVYVLLCLNKEKAPDPPHRLSRSVVVISNQPLRKDVLAALPELRGCGSSMVQELILKSGFCCTFCW